MYGTLHSSRDWRSTKVRRMFVEKKIGWESFAVTINLSLEVV